MKHERITLAHGSGGQLSRELVDEVIRPAFDNPILNELHDGAKIALGGAKLAFTTDSYVVKPLFFPGGNIGKLAICGTVNDLAMTGAVPKFISAGFILEEGFPLAQLQTIVAAMRTAADEAGVQIVTGDTKVVGKGAADGIYINTAGVGELIAGADITPRRVKPGQDIIVSGCLGDHAATIMAERHGLTLPEAVCSDCAPLNTLVERMLEAAPDLAVLRDPTRGGAAATLNEIAEQSGTGILLEETELPIRPAVVAFCDILGFDPLYLANEGKLLAAVDPSRTEALLTAMRAHPYGKEACVIGKTTDRSIGQVALRTAVGGIRIVDMPQGEQIPRIC